MSWLQREFFQTCQVWVSLARLWVQGACFQLPKLSHFVHLSLYEVAGLSSSCLAVPRKQVTSGTGWAAAPPAALLLWDHSVKSETPHCTLGNGIPLHWALRSWNPANFCPNGAPFGISDRSQGMTFVPLDHSAMSRGILGLSCSLGGGQRCCYTSCHAQHRSPPNTKHDQVLHERPCLVRAKFRVPLLQSFKQSV